MKKVLFEKPARILQIKENLERVTELKITNRGKEIYLDGTPENEFIAEKIFDALSFGFPLEVALGIKQENFHFEIINIKEYTKRNDLTTVRGRIIGAGGKTLKTLCILSNCFFEIKDNRIGIIGPIDYIKGARESVIALINGSKQANVYRSLEKVKVEPIEDLGIKKSFEKKLKNKNIDD